MKLDKNNINGSFENTLMDTLGIRFDKIEEDNSIQAFMAVDKRHVQTMGVLHGGASITLAETVAGVGSNLLCSDNEAAFGMQVSANHLSATCLGDTVRAKGVLLHKGKSTHIWDINVYSEATGKIVSSVRITNMIVRKEENI